MKLLQVVVWIVLAIVVVGLIFIDYEVLTEAYGSGPPYYGRTTNMDKWESPLPFLAAANAAGIAVVILGLWLTRRFGVRRSPDHP